MSNRTLPMSPYELEATITRLTKEANEWAEKYHDAIEALLEVRDRAESTFNRVNEMEADIQVFKENARLREKYLLEKIDSLEDKPGSLLLDLTILTMAAAVGFGIAYLTL